MPQLVDSLRKFVLLLTVIIAAALTVAFTFDQFIAVQIKLTILLAQTIRILILVAFGSIIIALIRRSKPVIERHIGAHPATVFQFFSFLIVSIVMIFMLLNIFQVAATTLLVGGGIVSIVIGLVISTFVGNILAGTLVLMTRPFEVGDVVIINNMPGRIEEITSMVTRIRNDIGGLIVVPNTAIMQGGVIITKFASREIVSAKRLPYALGDRIATTYMPGEGTVKELTSFTTKIILDSGKELTFLNTSVISGSVAVAKISQEQERVETKL